MPGADRFVQQSLQANSLSHRTAAFDTCVSCAGHVVLRAARLTSHAARQLPAASEQCTFVQDTGRFVQQVLQDESLANFLQQRVVLWGTTCASQKGQALAAALSVRGYPYLGLLQPRTAGAAGGGSGGGGGVQLALLATLVGPCTAAQVRLPVLMLLVLLVSQCFCASCCLASADWHVPG